jgi:hypothetical protein
MLTVINGNIAVISRPVSAVIARRRTCSAYINANVIQTGLIYPTICILAALIINTFMIFGILA